MSRAVDGQFGDEVTPGLAELVQDLRDLAAWALEDAEAPRERPVQIGRYRVVDYLGGGGQATLWLAYDVDLQRFVVIKRYRPGWMAGDGSALAEARAICAVRHPNLIVCHALETDEAGDFLVLEPIAGKALHQVLSRRVIGLEQLVLWFRDLADAVAALHGRGFAHRDIAARNVVIDGQDRAVLVDLGLARSCRGTSPMASEGHAERDGFAADVLALWQLLGEIFRRMSDSKTDIACRRALEDLLGSGKSPASAQELKDGLHEVLEAPQRRVRRRRFMAGASVAMLAAAMPLGWRASSVWAESDWDPDHGRRCWRDYLATVRGMPSDLSPPPPALPQEIPAMLIGSGIVREWRHPIEVVRGEPMEFEVRSTHPLLLSAFRLRTSRAESATVLGIPMDLGLTRDVPSFRWRLKLEAPDPESLEFLYLIASDTRFDGLTPIPGPSVLFRTSTGETVPALPPGNAAWISERVVRVLAV